MLRCSCTNTGLLERLQSPSLHMSQDLQNCSSTFEDDIPHLSTPMGQVGLERSVDLRWLNTLLATATVSQCAYILILQLSGDWSSPPWAVPTAVPLFICAFTSPGRSLLHRQRGPLAARAGLLQSSLRAVLTQTCKVLRDSLAHGIPGRKNRSVESWSGWDQEILRVYSCVGQEPWDSVVLLPVPAVASIHPEEQNGQPS